MANSPCPAHIRQKTICNSAFVVALASSKIKSAKITRLRKAHELRIFAFSRCQNSPEMSITTHDTGQQHSLNVCLPGAEKNLWNQTSEGHTSAGLPREWRRAPFIVAHFRHTLVNPWEVPRRFAFFLLNYSLFYARDDASIKCRRVQPFGIRRDRTTLLLCLLLDPRKAKNGTQPKERKAPGQYPQATIN